MNNRLSIALMSSQTQDWKPFSKVLFSKRFLLVRASEKASMNQKNDAREDVIE